MACNTFCNGTTHYYIDCCRGHSLEATREAMVGAMTSLAYVGAQDPSGTLVEIFASHGMTESDHTHLVSVDDAPEAEFGEWHSNCEGTEHRAVTVGFDICHESPVQLDVYVIEF